MSEEASDSGAAVVSTTISPELAVAQLYQDFPAAGADLIIQPRNVLVRYFDQSLADLILADRACVEESNQVCNLDFSPMWASQDPEASDLDIRAAGATPVVNVSYRYPGNGEIIRMIYEMTDTPEGWRISDIQYDSGASLRELLRGGR